MKKRDYKDFAKDGFYHIYNRGVGKMNVFIDDQDHEVFLSRLRENLFPENIDRSKISWLERRRKSLPPNSYSLVCYCLMPNHFHLIIQQLTDLAISKILLKVCTSYSMYFNKKYKRVGTLFQDQFKAVPIENNEQLLWTAFYIHKNPIEAGLVSKVQDYKWNSYLDYTEATTESICRKEVLLCQFSSADSFASHFKESIKSEETNYKMIGLQDLLIDDE